jgi:hypothetical protein
MSRPLTAAGQPSVRQDRQGLDRTAGSSVLVPRDIERAVIDRLKDQSDAWPPRARTIGLYFGLYLTAMVDIASVAGFLDPLRQTGAFAGRFRNARFWRIPFITGTERECAIRVR